MFILATFFLLGTRNTGYLLSSSHKPARSLSNLEVPHTVSLTELTCFEIHLFTSETNPQLLAYRFSAAHRRNVRQPYPFRMGFP